MLGVGCKDNPHHKNFEISPSLSLGKTLEDGALFTDTLFNNINLLLKIKQWCDKLTSPSTHPVSPFISFTSTSWQGVMEHC